jgi:hypothetical protein
VGSRALVAGAGIAYAAAGAVLLIQDSRRGI